MKGDRLDNHAMSLPYGNLAVADSGVTLDAADTGTVVDLIELPPGARVIDVKLVNAALGATTTVKVGYRFPDGVGTAADDGFIASGSSVSAGSRSSAIAPKQFSARTIVTATTGGAATTGRLDV